MPNAAALAAAASSVAMQELPSPTTSLAAASSGSSLPISAIQAAVQTQLPQSLVRSRISSSPTLLPTHLAQLVTALSLCARVSLRASALFIEAIVEGLQCGTVTGLGLTRRALIAAVGSARALHHVKEGLDWSGRDKDGGKSECVGVPLLNSRGAKLTMYTYAETRSSRCSTSTPTWASTSCALPPPPFPLIKVGRLTGSPRPQIHHTFTLAELFAMSGFYLTLNTLSTGFSAAEESVRMLDSILGSNESSRALSSIITLVRNELTREDPRFRPVGLLADQKEEHDEQQRKAGALSNITALTKALPAFACLQTATHRRTLRELKMRVVYDCTVVVEGQSTFSSSSSTSTPDSSPNAPSVFDVTIDDAGKYAGPSAPPRVPRLPRKSSVSTLSTRTRESSAVTNLGGGGGGEILTDVRGELEARAAKALAAQPGTATHSRRTSGLFELGASGSASLATAPEGIVVEPSLEVDPIELLDRRSEEEIVSELESLCGGRVGPSRHRRRTSGEGGYEGDAEGAFVTADEQDTESEMEDDSEYDDAESVALDLDEAGGEIPSEVQAALREIDARYSLRDKARAPSFSSGASTVRGGYPPRRARRGAGGQYSYEIEVEETTTTTTTTVRTVEEVPTDDADRARMLRQDMRPRMPGTLLLESSSSAVPTDVDEDMGYGSDATASGRRTDEAGEWVEVGSLLSPTTSVHRRSTDLEMPHIGGELAPGSIPSSPNGGGDVKLAASRWANLAGLSRQEALEHPEESKQRLQVRFPSLVMCSGSAADCRTRSLTGGSVDHDQEVHPAPPHGPSRAVELGHEFELGESLDVALRRPRKQQEASLAAQLVAHGLLLLDDPARRQRHRGTAVTRPDVLVVAQKQDQERVPHADARLARRPRAVAPTQLGGVDRRVERRRDGTSGRERLL